MAIHFDALPSEIEGSNKVLDAGKYIGVVTKAEMRTSSSTGKSYLSVTFDLYDINTNKKVGILFDKQFESEKQLLQAKLRKFMEGCDIRIREFELSDLAKLCVGKKCFVNIKIGKDTNGADINEVNVFNDPYEPITNIADADFVKVGESEDGELPFPMNEPKEAVADSEY